MDNKTRYIMIVGRGMNKNITGYLNLPERKFLENDTVIYIDYNDKTIPTITSLFSSILYELNDDYKINENTIYFDRNIKKITVLFDFSTFPCMMFDETNFTGLISFVKQYNIFLEIQVPLENADSKIKPYIYFPFFHNIFNGFKIENKNEQHYLFDWTSTNNKLFDTISSTNYILITSTYI
jgi:hypothetical protein